MELSLSTLADQIGAITAKLALLHALIAAHVMAAGRLHGDDTPVPLLARGKVENGERTHAKLIATAAAVVVCWFGI